MQAFATVEKLQARLKREFAAFYGADSAALDLAQDDINEASSLVEGYVGRRYALPMVAIPAILTTLTLDIAVYKGSARGQDEVPQKHKDAYDSALRQLRDISSGTLALPGAEEKGSAISGGSSGVDIVVNEPQFTRSQLKGY